MGSPFQVWRLVAVSWVILFCAGCAALENGTTTIKPLPLSSYSADPSLELGSRNNPFALGNSVDINEWKVQVINVNKDALQLVMATDDYASPPKLNVKYVLFNIKATYFGGMSGEPSSDLRFKIVGSSGNTFTQSCGYYVDTFSNNGETFSGATVTGNLCFSVDSNQIDGATISIQGEFSSPERQFISVD